MNNNQDNLEEIVPENENLQVQLRRTQLRLILCPLCEAVYFATYREALAHLFYPPVCFGNNGNRVPPMAVYNNTYEVDIAPVQFHIRIPLMFGWSITWFLYQLFHYIAVVPIMTLRVSIIQPTVLVIYWILDIPRRLYENLQLICVHVVAPLLAYIIGIEGDIVEEIFRKVENAFRWLNYKVEYLNTAMYNIIFFPLNLQDGTTLCDHHIYRVFFSMHVAVLIWMCLLHYAHLFFMIA